MCFNFPLHALRFLLKKIPLRFFGNSYARITCQGFRPEEVY